MLDNPILNSDPLGDSAILPPQFYIHKNVDGDQTGEITNATSQEYRENPVRALGKDILHVAAEMSGLNSVDDLSATLKDPDASATDKVLAILNVGLSTPGEGVKSGGEFKVPTIKEQALQLKELNGGKNSVSINTPSKLLRYDLDGKPHAKVETPHTQVYKKNFFNGERKALPGLQRSLIPLLSRIFVLLQIILSEIEKDNNND